MAIKYLAGERIIGTAAERTALTIGSSMGSDGDATNSGADLVTSSPSPALGSGCLDFNGSSDYINMTNLLTNTAMTTTGTIAFWIRFDAVDNGKRVFIFGDSNGTASHLHMEIESSGSSAKVMVGCDIGGTAQWQLRMAAGLLSVDTWYHVALTHNGTRPYIYLNGVDQTTTQVTTDLTKWISGLTGLDSLNWGRYNHNNSTDAYFDGKFDDIGIWNTALPIGTDEDTAGSIKWLYDTGTGRLANTISTGLRAYYNCDSATVTNGATNTYPNLSNGTLFEESDTGKHYMFDGTDTWNEVT